MFSRLIVNPDGSVDAPRGPGHDEASLALNGPNPIPSLLAVSCRTRYLTLRTVSALTGIEHDEQGIGRWTSKPMARIRDVRLMRLTVVEATYGAFPESVKAISGQDGVLGAYASVIMGFRAIQIAFAKIRTHRQPDGSLRPGGFDADILNACMAVGSYVRSAKNNVSSAENGLQAVAPLFTRAINQRVACCRTSAALARAALAAHVLSCKSRPTDINAPGLRISDSYVSGVYELEASELVSVLQQVLDEHESWRFRLVRNSRDAQYLMMILGPRNIQLMIHLLSEVMESSADDPAEQECAELAGAVKALLVDIHDV